jgi:putative tryptophan/tyrosine transport system substrate-binding protein
MTRREFITLLGGVAAAWPVATQGQQPAMPVVGFLSGASPNEFAHLAAAFRQGLNDAGFGDGRNAAIEYRWADGDYERLPALAAELVRQPVDVLVTSGGTPSLRAASAATKTIPVVFVAGNDPVKLGLVASLSRPGGNLTGVYLLTTALVPKRLGLLREIVTTAPFVALLVNPANPSTQAQVDDIQQAARSINLPIHIVRARTGQELDAAFAELTERRAGALLVAADPFFNSRREYIVALAARHAIPAMYEWREFALAGGLMTYGPSLVDGYRQAGTYVGRVLKGENPADLPVTQAAKFELVINLKTAATLGLTVPNSMQLLADEVIE